MNTISKEQMEQYARHLRTEERSAATVEKYKRDVTAFAVWLGKQELTKEQTQAWKARLPCLNGCAHNRLLFCLERSKIHLIF